MRYRSLIVFRLGGWSPLLPTGFLVSRGTLVQATYLHLPLRACHPLRSSFPEASGQLLSDVACPQPRASVDHWFGLLPLRSPLLRHSSFHSSPPGTYMFHFPGCPPMRLLIHLMVTGHYPSRVPPFGNPWLNAYVRLPTAYRSLSRPSSAISALASTLRSYSLDLASPASGFLRLLRTGYSA